MVGYLCDNYISIEKFYTIFHMNLPENHFSGNEHYDFWELVYVVDGEINTTAGSSIYNLKKNSLILYEPSEFHTLSVDSGKSAEIFILSFSLSGSATDKLKLLPFVLNKPLQNAMNNIIDFCRSNSSINTTDNYYTAYHPEFLSSPLFLPKICTLTEFLLLSLCDATPQKISATNTRDTMLFSALTDSMKTHKDTFMTIEHMSKIHNASPTKIKSLIKKHTGLSLHKYYIDIKLTQAVELFRKGLNISEVSRELGFCDPNYFSFVFKRVNNETPSQYLKKLKKVL